MRIRTLLPAVALLFTPLAKADTLQFNYGGGFLTWSLDSTQLPDQGSFAANDFTFIRVPIVDDIGRLKTFDVHFLLLDPLSTNLIITYDPSSLQFDNIFRLQDDGFDGMWNANGFVLGSYARGGLTITEAPEPPSGEILFFGGLLMMALILLFGRRKERA